METVISFLQMLLDVIEYIKEHMGLIIAIVIIGYIWKKVISPHIKEYKRRRKLSFNEYDELHKIEQDFAENEQLENELNITQKKQFEDDSEDEILESLPISRIEQEDNSFDAELFKKWSKNIFLYLQLGNAKDLKQIKHSVEDQLIERRIELLSDFERDNLELKREKLLVKEIKILDYAKWMDKSQIKVYIRARLKEYIIHKETQKILRGNKRKVYEKNFIMTFQKIDSNEQEGFINNCQSCGATIADTEFGKCQYCGSLVNPIRYNWKLIKYEVL